MLAYWRGCSGSFLAACLVYFAYNHFLSLTSYFGLVLAMIPFILLGSVFGYALWYMLQAKRLGFWAGFACFILLGLLYSLAFHSIFPFIWIFHWVIVVGALFFYLAQLLPNRAASTILAFSGPFVALVLGFAARTQ